MTKSTFTRDQYNILSNRENFDDAKKKLIDGAKFELLETLQIEKKLVNRKTFCEALAKNRYENGVNKNNIGIPAGTINTGIKNVKIDIKKYQNILQDYQELVEKKPRGYEKLLEILDVELAEQLTLDNGLAIEFKGTDVFEGGKTAENESKITFEKLNKIKKYKDKIEWIMKNINGVDLFIIKWTEKDIKLIEEKIKEIEEQETKEGTLENNKESKEIKEGTLENNKESKETKEGTLENSKESKEIIDTSLFINRDNLADAIKKTREGNGVPSGNIEIQIGVFVEIEKQTKYEEFKTKYQEAKGNELILKDLDTQFAEFMILNNPEGSETKNRYYIQINNDEEGENTKSEAKLEKESFRCRDSLIKEGYDVEYIQYQEKIDNTEEKGNKIKEMEGLVQEIGYIEKKIRELESELNSKNLYYTETGRIVKQEELKKLKKKLKKLLKTKKLLQKDMDTLNIPGKKYHIIRLKTKKPKPIDPDWKKPPRKKQLDDIPSEAEVTATLSNTYKVREAIAERKAGEELRDKREKTIPRNFPQKLNLLLRRKSIKENIMQRHLNVAYREKTGKLNRDKDSVAAADRHEIEEQEKFNDKIENIVGTMAGIENDYPNTHKQIVLLAQRFIGNQADQFTGSMNEATFKSEFEKILQRSHIYDSTRPTGATMPSTGKNRRRQLNQLLDTNDMTQLSTNIFEKISTFKAHQKLVYEIKDTIDTESLNYKKRATDTNQFDAFSKAIDTTIRPMIAKYIKDYHTMPAFLKTLKLDLNNPNVMKDLINLTSHHCALTSILNQSLKLKLQILNKGEEAYDVQEKLNRVAKTGRRLDDPFKKSKYLKKHPGLKNFVGKVRGVTKFLGFAAPGVVAGFAGAPLLAYAGIFGASAFIKTYFAKYSHYNKEHRLYQRKQAVELNKTRTERDKIANAVAGMNRRQGRFRGKNMRLRRQFKYYVKTTHDQLDNSETLIQDMELLLTKQTASLTTNEQDTLRIKTIEALARLDYHKDTGQNFLGSDQPKKAEEEYQKLQRLVLTSSLMLNTDLPTLRKDTDYTTIKKLCKEGIGNKKEYNNQGYEKARKRFKQREWQQATLGATKAGAVAFGMAYAMGSLTSKAATEHTTTTGTETTKAEYAMGQRGEVYSSGNLETDITSYLNDPSKVSSGGKFNIVLTGSTDATYVLPNSVLNSPTIVTTTKQDILLHIRDLYTSGDLNGAYVKDLIKACNDVNPTSFAVAQHNQNLAALRTLNGIRELTDSLANSTNPVVSGGGIDLNIMIYDKIPAGTIPYNQSERFVAAAMNTQNTVVTPGTEGFGFGDGFDNTFAINDTENKDKTPNADNNKPEYDEQHKEK